jgi:hypothetical protein
LTKVMVTSEGFPHMTHHADGRGFPHFYPDVHHLVRGDVHQKSDVAQQGFLQVLMRDDHTTADWNVAPPDDWTRTSFRRNAGFMCRRLLMCSRISLKRSAFFRPPAEGSSMAIEVMCVGPSSDSMYKNCASCPLNWSI